eukprot:CAMPEP_0167759592 /NCGR_PEP_ID=MMETSP0110_2-20121227/11110_1 /TAXON_ID=629695 /ORGANISM="Gymnochlora sp., Strain CCMP2014" /LENGTH=620 /DNA_ID=CAMNT_0007645997 /DNA_START=155 /DNA_END=2017 /DNA_ORIENTATION=+
MGFRKFHDVKTSAVPNKGMDMLSKRYDLVILGGGPTGCAAAEAAAYAGHSAMVIDDPGSGAKVQLGGPTGLFSKALRDTAKRVDVQLLKTMGISDRSIWSQVQEMCKEIALVETQNTVKRLRNIAVPRMQGKARFIGPNEVALELRNGKIVPVSADNFLIATGSSAFIASDVPVDGRRVFDSDCIRELSYLPRSVAITGAGIIAIEYAKIFSKLGAEVSILIRDSSFNNAMERVGIDKDVAEELKQELLESGVRLLFKTQVGKFKVPPSLSKPIEIELLEAKTNKPMTETLEVDTYLFAAGRIPNTQDLGLEDAGIQKDEKGRILVDCNLQTSAKGVYAAGDCLGPPGLASTGIEQGIAAVKRMFDPLLKEKTDEGDGFDPSSYLSDPDRFPVGIWTTPEVAYIGVTKEKALSMDIDAVEGIAQYRETTRGRVQRINRGLLKLVVDKGKRDLPVIGVSIIGEDACELVHYGMELVQSRRSLGKVLAASHAAVTYHELYTIAAGAVDSQLEFGVRLRSALPLDTLLQAKAKFQEAIAAGLAFRDEESSKEGDPAFVKIPYEEAEDIAAELGLLPLGEEKVGMGAFSYSEFLEYLRQLSQGRTSEASARAAISAVIRPLAPA